MQDRPTIHELLEAVQRFIDEEIVPASEGRRQFLARVAANAVRLVDRELAHEEEQVRGEWTRLDALLGAEPPPASREALGAAIRRRTEALCARIRDGAADEDTPWRGAVLAHVRATVHDKLVVTNPTWLEGS